MINLFKIKIKIRMYLLLGKNCKGGVMVSVLVLSAVDHGFEHLLGQSKDNKIGICYFSAKKDND